MVEENNQEEFVVENTEAGNNPPPIEVAPTNEQLDTKPTFEETLQAYDTKQSLKQRNQRELIYNEVSSRVGEVFNREKFKQNIISDPEKDIVYTKIYFKEMIKNHHGKNLVLSCWKENLIKDLKIMN